jgi:hypothetical protein
MPLRPLFRTMPEFLATHDTFGTIRGLLLVELTTSGATRRTGRAPITGGDAPIWRSLHMPRVWSTLLVMVVACLIAVNSTAQEKKRGKGGDRPSPESRFDALEKAAKHDPLTGVLTKEEFVKAMKDSGSRMADRAEEIFTKLKKADEKKITKDEFVKGMKEMFQGRGKRGGEKKPQ